MVDLAKRDGLELDPKALEHELGVPVIETVAVFESVNPSFVLKVKLSGPL